VRSYHQYCGLAKALDLVGDRWTLLIVRELLIRGACRYTDLRDGLPGIATNLLAERLRELQAAGIVSREDAPPPIATTLFRLTPRGRELEAALLALGSWGAPLLAQSNPDDAVRAHWLTLPLQHYLRDRTPAEPPISIELRTGQEPVLLETADGKVRASLGAAPHPDAVIAATPQLILALLTGKLDLPRARTAGLHYSGSPAILRRVRRTSSDARSDAC
jgi:DNA-binding HxlR family transcriptional regulator